MNLQIHSSDALKRNSVAVHWNVILACYQPGLKKVRASVSVPKIDTKFDWAQHDEPQQKAKIFFNLTVVNDLFLLLLLHKWIWRRRLLTDWRFIANWLRCLHQWQSFLIRLTIHMDFEMNLLLWWWWWILSSFLLNGFIFCIIVICTFLDSLDIICNKWLCILLDKVFDFLACWY